MRSSRPSFRFLILSPPSAAVARARLLSCRVRIRSSTVFSIVSLYMLTSRVWPKRWARSKAWSSSAGFHHMSTKITLLHAVKLRPGRGWCKQLCVGGAIRHREMNRLPVLPALNDIKITRIRLLFFICSRLTSRLSLDMLPSSWWGKSSVTWGSQLTWELTSHK